MEARSSIVVLRLKSAYGLGLVTARGRIATCFHVVEDEPEVQAQTADGALYPVLTAAGADARRNLVLLEAPSLPVPPVAAWGPGLVPEGTAAFVYGLSSEATPQATSVRVEAVQVLGPGFSVYRLAGEVPHDASGGPLVGPDGAVLGIVTVVRTDAGPLPLAVPMRYLDAVPTAPGLLKLPLNAPAGRRRRREVPEHPLSLLEGASLAGLEATTDGLASAIRVGAPAYNRGDIEGCYRLYAAEARRLVRERGDCPGVQEALQAGLERALRLEDVDDRAWALRDTFDGVLNVIERYLRQRTGGLGPAPAPKASLPN